MHVVVEYRVLVYVCVHACVRVRVLIYVFVEYRVHVFLINAWYSTAKVYAL